jgi:hypothetical protein
MTVSLVAASPAQAYLGETYVETSPGGGAGDTLTGPAKTILANPTFLPNEVNAAQTAGGTTLAEDTVTLAEGSGIFPEVGLALGAFGLGAGIGSVICNEILELEGCWGFSSNGTDPAVAGPPEWKYFKDPPEGCLTYTVCAGAPHYTWWYHSTTSAPYRGVYVGKGGLPNPCEGASSLPAAADGYFSIGTEVTWLCEVKGVHKFGYQTLPQASKLTGTNFNGYTKAGAAATGLKTYTGTGYCPTASPTTCLNHPPSNWGERFARGLHNTESGASSEAKADLGQAIAHAISPSTVKNPYGTYVNVPDCDGLVYATCAKELEEAGLEPHREDLDWSEVTTTTPDEVTELQPAKSTEVEKGTGVKVITNPDEEGMPVVIPDVEPDETYSHYAARLNPALSPHRVNVGEAFTDAELGPSAVLRVAPSTGTKVDPHASTEVEVQTNPETAPDAGPGTSAWTAPSIPSIDLSPLAAVSIGCSSFPFGVFCWIGDGLTSWGSSGTCPSFGIPIHDSELAVDFCQFEPAMEIIRPVLVVLACFTLAAMFAYAALGIGGGAGSDD